MDPPYRIQSVQDGRAQAPILIQRFAAQVSKAERYGLGEWTYVVWPDDVAYTYGFLAAGADLARSLAAASPHPVRVVPTHRGIKVTAYK